MPDSSPHPSGTGREDAARVVLVTGAGRRLGRRIALAFAAKGYDVALHAHRSVEGMEQTAERIRGEGRRVWTVQGDLARVADIRALAADLRARIPRLDVLVNNAGVFPGADFADVDEAMWDDAMNVNARAVFFLTQSLAPVLRASRGAVVNIASMGGMHPWRRHIPYNASKAALIMLTRALARELAPDVRVNAVAPGIIIVPGEEERSHPPADRIPLARYGTVDDLTSAVLFLASDAAYITGHILPVDGGASATA